MAPQSETSRLIDSIIAAGPAALLKDRGFRKSARSFHAQAGDLFQVVQFQASMWNTPDSARFTINLNIVLPFFHEKWTGKPFPKNPGSAAPIITQRIGLLMAGKTDHWWEISPESDVPSVARDVSTALSTHGLPFLDQHTSLDLLLREAGKKTAASRFGTNPDLCAAIHPLLSGQPRESRTSHARPGDEKQARGFRRDNTDDRGKVKALGRGPFHGTRSKNRPGERHTGHWPESKRGFADATASSAFENGSRLDCGAGMPALVGHRPFPPVPELPRPSEPR